MIKFIQREYKAILLGALLYGIFFTVTEFLKNYLIDIRNPISPTYKDLLYIILNILGTIDGFGTRRAFGIYIGINLNLSKLNSIINSLFIINWYSLILSSHSSSSSLFSFLLPLIGISISERLRDRGIDSIIWSSIDIGLFGDHY